MEFSANVMRCGFAIPTLHIRIREYNLVRFLVLSILKIVD